MNKMSLSLQEKQYLFPLVLFELSSKNYNFGECVSASMSLTALSICKYFSEVNSGELI
jgi:hypothetical protein